MRFCIVLYSIFFYRVMYFQQSRKIAGHLTLLWWINSWVSFTFVCLMICFEHRCCATHFGGRIGFDCSFFSALNCSVCVVEFQVQLQIIAWAKNCKSHGFCRFTGAVWRILGSLSHCFMWRVAPTHVEIHDDCLAAVPVCFCEAWKAMRLMCSCYVQNGGPTLVWSFLWVLLLLSPR